MGIGGTRRHQRSRRGMTGSGTRPGHGGDIGQMASERGFPFRAKATRLREALGRPGCRLGELREGREEEAGAS
jgi:hypothetical protein